MARPDDQHAGEGLGSVRIAYDRQIPGVLRIRVSGRGGDAAAALRRWYRFVAMAREAGLRRMLVVRDLDGPLIDETDLAMMVERLSASDLTGLRVALVQTRHDRQRIDEVGSLLAMEHGAQVRVFTEEATAALWLRHGGD